MKNIIITGCTCSGKTTLASEIVKNKRALIIHQDNYFKDLKDIPRGNGYYLMDSVNAFHKEEFVNDVTSLLAKGYTYVPNYDININQRIDKNIKMLRTEFNIFEGLHTIALLKDINNSLKIFLDMDMAICLNRRINRDSQLFKIDSKKIKEYFYNVVIPMYKLYIEPQKEVADIIVRKESDRECLLKKLTKF